MKKEWTIIFLLALTVSACLKEKALLSDDLKLVNPYVVGQTLNFISNGGERSQLKVVEVKDRQFPDALGAFQNERLVVNAYRESKTDINGTEETILTIFARSDKHEERIDFSISLKDAYLNMNFVSVADYLSRKPVRFSTRFAAYNDVLLFEHQPERKINDKEIVAFYWSKTKGYVRLVQRDGTVWDLEV